MRIAIVGGGIAGLSAAWALSKLYSVTLFEARKCVGGHANTVIARHPFGCTPVDTGFIVYNEKNYPYLSRLFRQLNVETQPSNMSFGVSLDGGAMEYEGSLRGMIAQPSNLIRPGYYRMCCDIARFYKTAPAVLKRPDGDVLSLGSYLRQEDYSTEFVYNHLLPMGSAIWSCSCDDMLAFPAGSFVRFFHNHGLLSFSNRPKWRTVVGGSREYLKQFTSAFSDSIRLNTPIVGLRRDNDGIHLRTQFEQFAPFDSVILATHADQTLKIIGADATELECSVLGKIRYSKNRAILHQDPKLMPHRRKAWASWNYLSSRSKDGTQQVSVTYWMNRLQNLDERVPLFVSLNPIAEPEPNTVLGHYSYEHPILDLEARVAQTNLQHIQGQRNTWFCGSYTGYGFHEDGLKSGLLVAESMGAPAPWTSTDEPR